MKIALEIPEGYSYIAMVRRIGRTLLEHHRAPEGDIDDVETLVGELCSNVSRHARSEAGLYRVTLEHHDSHVVVMVADAGRGFDPQGLPPVGEVRSDDDGSVRFGGFGLQLVRHLADHLDIETMQPRGTTVRAEKRFKCASPSCER